MLNTPVIGTAEQVTARVQAVVDAGANYILAYFPGIGYDHMPLRRFAEEVIPQVRG